MGGLEYCLTEVQGGTAVECVHDFRYAVRSELRAATFGFDDALGDQEHARSGLEGLDVGLEGEVCEEAERHRNWPEDAGAVVVSKDWRLAARVDVSEETKGQVVAAEKGWSQARAACGFVDGAIDLVRQGAEGVHHIDDVCGEELWRAMPEDVLYGGCDGVGFVADPGDVGEKKDDVGADRDRVEEVATGSRGVITRAQVEAVKWRQNRGQRCAGGLKSVRHGWWRLYVVRAGGSSISSLRREGREIGPRCLTLDLRFTRR
jgi:hypothetical protein